MAQKVPVDCKKQGMCTRATMSPQTKNHRTTVNMLVRCNFNCISASYFGLTTRKIVNFEVLVNFQKGHPYN